MPTNVIDTCNVIKSPALKSQTNWNKKNWQIRKQGTRVFKHHDVDYCSPSYIHDDGEWAVFFCYEEDRAKEVESILKSYPGQSEMFKTDKYLARLGAFYRLSDYEKFGDENIDRYTAAKFDNKYIEDMTDIELNGKPWQPTAEVVQLLAIKSSYVYPSGDKVHVDVDGFPNMTSVDQSQLKNAARPSYPISHGDGSLLFQDIFTKDEFWTPWTVHIHPLGATPSNNSECPNITCDVISYHYRGTSGGHNSCSGPSEDDRIVHNIKEIEDRNKINKNIKYKSGRSVIVSRNFISLYNSGEKGKEGSSNMLIRRRNPGKQPIYK